MLATRSSNPVHFAHSQTRTISWLILFLQIAATKSGSIYHKQGQRMDLGEMLGTLVRIQTLLILQSSAAGLQQNLFLHTALAQHKASHPTLLPLVKCMLRERQQGCPVSFAFYIVH